MRFDAMEWLRQLFGRVPIKTPGEQAADIRSQRDYESEGALNITAMVAGKLANIACGECEIEVVGEGPRAEYMRRCMARVSGQLRTIAARSLGVGGVWLVPYNVEGELYADVVEQSRVFVVEQRGAVATGVQYIADVQQLGGREYVRAVCCTLEAGGRCAIENRAMAGGREVPLSSVPAWAQLPRRVEIEGAGRLLMGFVKCPAEGRGERSALRGVPITGGQEQLLSMIADILEQVPDEYRLKKTFVGASDLLFGAHNRLPEEGLYKRFEVDGQIGEQPFWEVYSPEIRHEAYFAGLNYLLGLLEKAIGVNRGILTDLESADATATAIRRSTFDTFNVVDALRKALEGGVSDVAQAFDVLATAFGFAEPGEWALRFHWSYGLLEDSAETWAQLIEGYDRGIVTEREVREWLIPTIA